LSHFPFCFRFCFPDGISCFLPGLAWDHDLPTSASWVAEITGVNHRAWLDAAFY
jgi:hypothetical protein